MRISREWLHAPSTTAAPSRGGTRLWSRRAFLVATRHWCWTIPTPDRSARRRRRGSTPRGPRHAARGPASDAGLPTRFPTSGRFAASRRRRSEERRVGKEGRRRCLAEHDKNENREYEGYPTAVRHAPE